MGTRATYKIGDMVFYCHWDGYPAGAACRFANMVEAMTVPAEMNGDKLPIYHIAERRGGAAYAFIRGNMDAEPAYRNSRDGHGDTQYHYELCEDQGRLIVRTYSRAVGNDAWTGGTGEGLAEFINRHRNSDIVDVPLIVQVISRHSTRWHYATHANAVAIAELAERMGEHFKPDNPNRASYLETADQWRLAIDTTEDHRVPA